MPDDGTLSKEDDPWYALGSAFLKLPARASREGQSSSDVVGTAIHVEVLGRSAEPPYLSVAFEPATGDVLDCRAVGTKPRPDAFDVYEEVIWGIIGSYMDKLSAGDDAADRHKPVNITTTDSALADYMFGLLQGCGCDVVCIDATQKVQWPSARLLAGVGALPGPDADADAAPPASASAPEAPTVSSVQERVLAELVASGRVAAALEEGAVTACGALSLSAPPEEAAEAASNGAAAAPSDGGAAAEPSAGAGRPARSPLVLLGACHYQECARVAPRRALKRCSACKRMVYCSAACQRKHWDAGHRTACKDIQQMNLQQASGAGAAWT